MLNARYTAPNTCRKMTIFVVVLVMICRKNNISLAICHSAIFCREQQEITRALNLLACFYLNHLDLGAFTLRFVSLSGETIRIETNKQAWILSSCPILFVVETYC